MAISNRERVGRAFEALAEGLGPYLDRRMRATSPYGEAWFRKYLDQAKGLSGDAKLTDPAVQLRVIADCWDLAFRDELSRSDRNVVFELRDIRNRWAHNEAFSVDDAYRALDSIERLLTAIDATEAEVVGRSKDELMRLKYETAAKKATPTQEALVTEPAGGLRPWREVVEPHDDVARGRFALAEFAADLFHVAEGRGGPEYVDPVEFFRRTYLTGGLRTLLAQALSRLIGDAGVPVVNLQTNFGGGKTHSMIALYHLFSGMPLSAFPQEVQDLVIGHGISELLSVRRAVLVGTKLSPGQPDEKPDGTQVHTIWGELAWQLGGAEGYALVAESDRKGTNPGVALGELFRLYSPCLVLIDEWVAYARQLYGRDDLPGGTFETQFTFAQTLTEEADASPGTMVIVSLPASEQISKEATNESVGSEIEVGGTAGREALKRLRSVISREENPWQPATATESYEIVRRRLFKEPDAQALVDRDATARAFGQFYSKQKAEFPAECSQAEYVKRIMDAYPIHPELFDRLYRDWSTLERFQRTRGVLRLMAAVIHALWVRGDQAPLILPASVPLDDPPVVAELTRNLEDNWKPVVDTDIDGPHSRPVAIDRDFPNLGRYSAARRVARTVFLGSAPTLHTANRGIEAARVRLGCALPGETVATYGDALGKLTDRCTHLYVDNARYWYATQESVTSSARAEAERLLAQARDVVWAEIERRLRAHSRERGAFAGVHVMPATPADVPDDPECRLVILGPEHPHIHKADDSPALRAADVILAQRGTAARVYRNMLVVLAADQRRLEELEAGVADFLAWHLIWDEREKRNLDPHQANQAKTKRDDADRVVDLRIAETYVWCLYPTQPDPTGPISWATLKCDGQAALPARVSRKLSNEGALYEQYAPSLLRLQLDGVLAPRWADGTVSAGELWEDFARYVYLPRLPDLSTLLETVKRGPASMTWADDGFATADARDGERLVGLSMGELPGSVSVQTLLVRPDVARAHHPEKQGDGEDGTGTGGERGGEGTDDGRRPQPDPVLARPQRFYGTVELDPLRLNRDFGNVAKEVVAHLQGQVGVHVKVSLEIEASLEVGFDEKVVRDVSENARTLKFTSFGFEER